MKERAATKTGMMRRMRVGVESREAWMLVPELNISKKRELRLLPTSTEVEENSSTGAMRSGVTEATAMPAAGVLLLQQLVQDLMARHLQHEIHGCGKADAQEGRTRRFCLSQCGRVLQQE